MEGPLRQAAVLLLLAMLFAPSGAGLAIESHDAQDELIAVSLFGNATTTGYCLPEAHAELGDPCVAGVAVSGTGDASSFHCPRFDPDPCVPGPALSGTGDATGWIAASGTGDALARECDQYDRCFGVLAVSGAGRATAGTGLAIGGGGAEAQRGAIAVHGDPKADIVTLSLLGDTYNTECGSVTSVYVSLLGEFCLDMPTISVFGDAYGCDGVDCVAISVFGDAHGRHAFSASSLLP